MHLLHITQGLNVVYQTLEGHPYENDITIVAPLYMLAESLPAFSEQLVSPCNVGEPHSMKCY